MRTLYYDCFAGISGDMHLGALLDLSVEEGHVRQEFGRLAIRGYELRVARDTRQAIACTRVEVVLPSL